VVGVGRRVFIHRAVLSSSPSSDSALAVDPAGSTTDPARPTRVRSADFFRHYNRLLSATGLLVFLLTAGFLAYQMVLKRDQELRAIEAQVQRHAQFIEFIVRSAIDHVEAIRVSSASFYGTTVPIDGPLLVPARSALFRQLRDLPQESRFSLDELAQRDSSGNLTGEGSIRNRSARFYRDIEMALSLADDFQAVGLSLPSAVDVRFVGVERFAHQYPWAESSRERFDPAMLESALWRLAGPEENPQRRKVWGPVHFGGPAKGLLIPIVAPVYDGESFRGQIVLDLSLDYLNRINDQFAGGPGLTFVVDAQGQVLAHPALFKDPLQVTATTHVANAVAAQLFPTGRVQDIAEGGMQALSGHHAMRVGLLHAPWQVVYMVPTVTVWKEVLRDFAPATLTVLAALGVIIIGTFRLVSRDFISPAGQLVRQIAAESQFKSRPIPRVPRAWLPWFEAVSKAFRESFQLAGIRQELDIAAKMQQSILPRSWPQSPVFSLWGTMRPAKEVGGDFYDHFPLADGRLGLVVADVSGKGMPAALFSMVSKTLIRATALDRIRMPADTIAVVNDQLCVDNDACMFVTTFYLEFDPVRGRVVYVNAGHPPPLLIHADGSSQPLSLTGGAALGVMEGLPYDQAEIQMQSGDVLLLFTDGVTEAFSADEREFTEAALPPLFAGRTVPEVRAVVERVIAAVDDHSVGVAQFDDITCLALRWCPPADPSTARLAASTAAGEPA
jgi:sigma-B regulation protein RsbU (phosphoserine phosphatase)